VRPANAENEVDITTNIARTALEQKRINFIIYLLVCVFTSMHRSYHSFYVYKKYTVYLLVKNKQIKIVKNVDDKREGV